MVLRENSRGSRHSGYPILFIINTIISKWQTPESSECSESVGSSFRGGGRHE